MQLFSSEVCLLPTHFACAIFSNRFHNRVKWEIAIFGHELLFSYPVLDNIPFLDKILCKNHSNKESTTPPPPPSPRTSSRIFDSGFQENFQESEISPRLFSFSNSIAVDLVFKTK